MICKALVNRVACFLDNKKWRSVLHHESQSNGRIPDRSVRLSDHFYEILAALPALVQLTNSLHTALDPTMTQMLRVLKRAQSLRILLQRWYRELTTSTTTPFSEIPSALGDAIFPRVYHYENHHTMGLVCSYYTSLIVLNDITTSFPPCEDLSADNICYAKEICKSVEYAYSSGFQGAYSIILPLTMAHLVSRPEIRNWIKTWPSKFDKYFDVKVWEVFENMDAMGGLVEKKRHGKTWDEWVMSAPLHLPPAPGSFMGNEMPWTIAPTWPGLA